MKTTVFAILMLAIGLAGYHSSGHCADERTMRTERFALYDTTEQLDSVLDAVWTGHAPTTVEDAGGRQVPAGSLVKVLDRQRTFLHVEILSGSMQGEVGYAHLADMLQ